MSNPPEVAVTCPQAQQCAATQSLLVASQEKLQQAQQLLLQQEDRNQFLRDRVRTLEQDLLAKSEELAIAQSSCEDLRNRLKREQHQCSQLKAALERCIDAPTTIASATTPPSTTPNTPPIAENSWTEVEPIALFTEDKGPVPPLDDSRSPSPLIRRTKERQLSSFAAVQLPKFPRLPRA